MSSLTKTSARLPLCGPPLSQLRGSLQMLTQHSSSLSPHQSRLTGLQQTLHQSLDSQTSKVAHHHALSPSTVDRVVKRSVFPQHLLEHRMWLLPVRAELSLLWHMLVLSTFYLHRP